MVFLKEFDKDKQLSYESEEYDRNYFALGHDFEEIEPNVDSGNQVRSIRTTRSQTQNLADSYTTLISSQGRDFNTSKLEDINAAFFVSPLDE